MPQIFIKKDVGRNIRKGTLRRMTRSVIDTISEQEGAKNWYEEIDLKPKSRRVLEGSKGKAL